MEQKDLDKIIREYLSGKDSPEGKKLFDAWYGSHNDTTSPLNETDREKIRQEIFSKTQAALSVPPPKTPMLSEPHGRQLPPWYRMAAVWGGLLIISIALVLYLRYQRETTLIQTTYGEITRVILPDGSEATLNANSTLRYADDWGENTRREVWLEGEAFFSVVHTSDDRRFQVHTPNLNVEVLGTEFNVNNRRGDTEVVLHSGKVKLKVSGDEAASEIVMTPGELITYSEDDHSLTKKIVDPQHYSHWRNQELVLNNTSLAEIARALEDYYGFVVIIPDDTLKNIRLTATAKLSLKETEVILTAISEIYGIEVTQEGKQIIFNKP